MQAKTPKIDAASASCIDLLYDTQPHKRLGYASLETEHALIVDEANCCVPRFGDSLTLTRITSQVGGVRGVTHTVLMLLVIQAAGSVDAFRRTQSGADRVE